MERNYYIIFGIGAALILLLTSLFTVDQRESAVIFQFGEAVRVVEAPGLNMKVPFVQNVKFFDKRVLNVTAEAKELTAADGKRIIVDSFAKFKIVDPIKFYKTVNNYKGANLRLNRILESSMRQVIGKVNLSTLLSDERSDLMLSIRDIVGGEAKAFGIEVIDARITRADLPSENSAGVYRRMQEGRVKEAKLIRAEGWEESERIRARADKEAQIIISQSYMDSERIKGEGDAEAARLYNSAYSKDQEFYKFYRSLVSYKNALDKTNTTFVISPDAEYMKYLKIGK